MNECCLFDGLEAFLGSGYWMEVLLLKCVADGRGGPVVLEIDECFEGTGPLTMA
jgi:hypothetical protein